MKIINTIVSSIRIFMIHNIDFCIPFTEESCSHDVMNPYIGKIHVTIAIVRFSKSPYLVILSNSLIETSMTINSTIIADRIMFTFKVTFSDFTKIIQ